MIRDGVAAKPIKPVPLVPVEAVELAAAPVEKSFSPEISLQMELPHVLAALVVALMFCVLHGRIAWDLINYPSDSKAYVTMAEQWSKTGVRPKSHFLFPALTVAAYRSGLVSSFPAAEIAVLLASYSITAILIYWLLYRALRGRPWLGRPWLLAACALVIVLAQPLDYGGGYEIGYFWPTQHDNPPSALAKPFLVISFLGTAWCLAHRRRLGLGLCAISAAATVAGALSKPSFLICLLPAAGAIGLVRLVRRKDISITGLALCILVPGFLVLAWQYVQTFAGTSVAREYHDTIIWAPLVVMRHYSSDLVLKCVLSVAFPLGVTVLYWSRARTSTAMLLAWVSFLIGALYAYTLGEKANLMAGNFLWSPYAATFVLIVASALFFFRETPSLRGWRPVLCAALFTLHGAAGVMAAARYWRHFHPSYFW
ncbi:MAG: hypothetical protein ABI806_16365 [Candidatus Solibacter sp.]